MIALLLALVLAFALVIVLPLTLIVLAPVVLALAGLLWFPPGGWAAAAAITGLLAGVAVDVALITHTGPEGAIGALVFALPAIALWAAVRRQRSGTKKDPPPGPRRGRKTSLRGRAAA